MSWLEEKDWFFAIGLMLLALCVVGAAFIAKDIKDTRVGEKDGNPDN